MNQPIGKYLVTTIFVLVALSLEARAIPAFSRKYNVGCNTCHTVYPRLNDFGRDFKNNGFRTADELEPEPSQEKKDFWSQGFDALPLTVHGKINQEIFPKGKDVKTTTALDELQLNAGVNFSTKVSFYLHTHIWEEGEVGKPLVAAVRINDIFNNKLVSIRAGQYELPLSFSPEVERLMAFRYLAFSQSIGRNPFTLETPQLGVELTGDLGNDVLYWLGVVNGSGFEGTLDNNAAKDVYLRVAKNFGENTIGVFGYNGSNRILEDEETITLEDSSLVPVNHSDNFFRVGGDVNWSFSNSNLRSTVLYGRDGNYNGLGVSTTFLGGFVECNYLVTDRFVVLGRYDIVDLKTAEAAGASEESEEEESDTAEAQKTTWAVTPGFQYLILPNIKVGLEYQFRQTRDQDRAIVLLHFAL